MCHARVDTKRSTLNGHLLPVKATINEIVLESAIKKDRRIAASIYWPVRSRQSLLPDAPRFLRPVLRDQVIYQRHGLLNFEGLLQIQQPAPNKKGGSVLPLR